jgi:hypothetical protein
MVFLHQNSIKSNQKFKSNVIHVICPTKNIIHSIDCCIKEGCRFGRDMEVDKMGANNASTNPICISATEDVAHWKVGFHAMYCRHGVVGNILPDERKRYRSTNYMDGRMYALTLGDWWA